jgi:hypothetical protein
LITKPATNRAKMAIKDGKKFSGNLKKYTYLLETTEETYE